MLFRMLDDINLDSDEDEEDEEEELMEEQQLQNESHLPNLIAGKILIKIIEEREK